ncbi:hypothetical protein CAPTEDRAFT_221045 [Capitella teleta]|uniref:Uncharacterized protein n=1 Tax=Capitella teleta TaxID=283909 RepID=R7TWJ9_CAPTE|nr:hypothetical protein CAPTEDRAFT_221045 [Capitella teleta]|eukprot:ELT95791.1 hypothetical protein CAPTEDRAFT_221045 [Capitella teleta]
MAQRRERINSANSNASRRNSSALPDGFMPHEKVEQLQFELLNSQTELRRVSDQLNCLIMLVKKAWMGDSSAAKHVAKIVGVAPPDVDELEIDPDKMIANYITKPKSKALNHWALLTIGLLNRDYKQLERQLEEEQLQHLQQREQLLDRELSSAPPFSLLHRRPSLERRPRNNGFVREEEQRRVPARPPPSPVPSQDSQIPLSSRPSSAWKKPTVKHLYRTPQKNNDLEGGSRSKFNTLSDMGYTSEVAYDDPDRYSMFGLFDTNVLSPEKKRPPSGKKQRMEDRVRARPKSAVITGCASKGQRALRSETTTPIKPSTENRRAKSAGPAPKSQPSNQNQAPRKPIPKILPPESVVEFTNDVQQMNELEDNFKRSAVELQKRLGIPSAGLVF